jgi:hypothetical protein
MDFNIIGKIFKLLMKEMESVEVEPYNEEFVKVLYAFKEEHL